jgi:hypothetical protein
MKRQILLFASIIISTLAIAQSKPTFGIRAGASHSGMKGETVDNLENMLDFANGMITTNNRTGFFVGGYASIPVSTLLSVEPALYYTQKGYDLKGDLNIKGMAFLGANAKAKLNAQYIDMPVVLKANMNGFQVFAGPQISYLTHADLRTTAGVFGINLLNNKMDASDQFNRWDAAVTAGVGYQLSRSLNITAAYDHGLSRVDKNQNLNAYNRAFKVGLGVSF